MGTGSPSSLPPATLFSLGFLLAQFRPLIYFCLFSRTHVLILRILLYITALLAVLALPTPFESKTFGISSASLFHRRRGRADSREIYRVQREYGIHADESTSCTV